MCLSWLYLMALSAYKLASFIQDMLSNQSWAQPRLSECRTFSVGMQGQPTYVHWYFCQTHHKMLINCLRTQSSPHMHANYRNYYPDSGISILSIDCDQKLFFDLTCLSLDLACLSCSTCKNF